MSQVHTEDVSNDSPACPPACPPTKASRRSSRIATSYDKAKYDASFHPMDAMLRPAAARKKGYLEEEARSSTPRNSKNTRPKRSSTLKPKPMPNYEHALSDSDSTTQSSSPGTSGWTSINAPASSPNTSPSIAEYNAISSPVKPFTLREIPDSEDEGYDSEIPVADKSPSSPVTQENRPEESDPHQSEMTPAQRALIAFIERQVKKRKEENRLMLEEMFAGGVEPSTQGSVP